MFNWIWKWLGGDERLTERQHREYIEEVEARRLRRAYDDRHRQQAASRREHERMYRHHHYMHGYERTIDHERSMRGYYDRQLMDSFARTGTFRKPISAIKLGGE